ncbi:MAG: hypothetical protein QNI91_15890 [Arenicellales bacterium]|nr:hypothetical protein [Arenicellales bacterium]
MSAEHDWGFSPQSQDEEIPAHVSESRYKTALTNPTQVYDRPRAVVQDKSLEKSQKLKILESWAAEAIRLRESETEGFDGDEKSLLSEINNVLKALVSLEQSDKADAA